MIQALSGFAVLYGLLFVFERKKHDLGAFEIAAAIFVPLILSFLVQFIMALVGFPALSLYLSLLVLLAASFLFLWKLLGIGAGHAAAYTGVTVLTYLLVAMVVRSLVSSA